MTVLRLRRSLPARALAACAAIAILMVTLSLSSCQSSAPAPTKKTITVTYSVLGSLVKELVGDIANVVVPMPNGLDPHEWEPSARAIESFNEADLVVENGLGLEGGLGKTLEAAKSRGVKFFTASDHIDVRKVRPGEGIPSDDPDQVVGAADPHLWMDPIEVKAVIDALVPALKNELGIDVSSRGQSLLSRLDALNRDIETIVSAVPQPGRKLVTGHESLGYFADRYGFKLVGVIIPSLSSQAGVSAADLASLKTAIRDNNVKVIFSELGTPPAVARAIGQEAGVKVVQLATHVVPPDGSYFSYMRDLANTVSDALR
jgi:zinc/manganese transport system substrate-binding protein